MLIVLTILLELFFAAGLVILFYRLKPRLGLAPLYILIGSNQYFQTVLATSFRINIFEHFTISPGAIIIFSSGLFAILLIYIKEGTRVAQRLIFGIILANISFAILAWITNLQVHAMDEVIQSSVLSPGFFKLSSRVFFVGTLTLLLDAFLIVILYELIFTKLRWLNLYSRLLLTMLIVLSFDAVVFMSGSFWGANDLGNRIISQLIGKAIAAVFFATVLFLYLRYLDKDKKSIDVSIKKGREDIFSILTYLGKYEKLKYEKVTSDDQMQKIIAEKTMELEKSIWRFTVLSSVRELRMDKFSIKEQTEEFLIKVKEAFEADVCAIYILREDSLKLLSSIGINENDIKNEFPLTTRYVSEIIGKKKVVSIEDTRENPGFSSELEKDLIPYPFISYAGAPLLSGDKVTGVICLLSQKSKRVYTNLELEHFQIVASQVARAIENAKLFAQNEKQKEVLVKQIVARKKVEEAIKESEAKYRAFIEQAGDAILIYSFDGTIFEFNRSAWSVSGYTKEEFSKLSLRDILDGEIAVIPANKKKLREGKTIHVFRKFKKKDGSFIELEISVRMMTDGKLLGFGRDISERKKGEEKLKKFNERFEMIARTTKDSLWEWNLETGELWANQMHQHLYGLTSDDPVPTAEEWEQKIHPDDRERIIEAQREALASDKNDWISEYRFKTHHKGYLDIYDQTYVIRNEEGKAIHLMGSMLDITERKKAELEIRESEERYRDIVENITDLICTHDLDGRILSTNRAAEKITGHKFDSQKKFNIKDILTTGTKNMFDSYIAEIQKNGYAHGIMKVKIKSGEVRYWEFNNSLKTTGNNTPPVVRGFARDITEQKKAEETIRKSETKYRNVVENVYESLIVKDTEGRLIFANNEFFKMFGFSQDEIMNLSLKDYTASESYAEIKERYDRRMKGSKEPEEFEYKGRRKDGTEIWIECRVSTLIENGKITGTQSLERDITARKKSEEEKEQLLNVIQSSLNEIYMFAPDTLQFVYLNKGALNNLGYSMEEIIKMTPPDIKPEFTISNFRNLLSPLVNKKKEKIVFKTNHKRKDKSLYPVEVHMQLVTTSGQSVFLSVVMDITERKKAEGKIKVNTEQLHQLTAHLQTVREEERKRIGREIHDELGQQLTAIKMDVVWIDKKTTNEANPIKNKLKNIITLLDGSNQSVRKILSELRPAILDDYGLLEALEWQGGQFTENTSIPVKFMTNEANLRVPEDLAICIFRAYQESLTNIARHAQASQVLSSLHIDMNEIILTVGDDGKGFDIKTVQNKKTFGLLGMKERVRSLNGRFELISSAGKGSKIIISLPYIT